MDKIQLRQKQPCKSSPVKFYFGSSPEGRSESPQQASFYSDSSSECHRASPRPGSFCGDRDSSRPASFYGGRESPRPARFYIDRDSPRPGSFYGDRASPRPASFYGDRESPRPQSFCGDRESGRFYFGSSFEKYPEPYISSSLCEDSSSDQSGESPRLGDFSPESSPEYCIESLHGQGSPNRAFEYMSWNPSAMISCWKNVHGSTQEIENITEPGNASKGFLRSFSFTANSLVVGMQRSASVADNIPVTVLPRSSSYTTNGPAVKMFRSSSSTNNRRNIESNKASYARSNSYMSSNCKKELKSHTGANNYFKRVTKPGTGTGSEGQRSSLGSLLEEAGNWPSDESQKRSLDCISREAINCSKRRNNEFLSKGKRSSLSSYIGSKPGVIQNIPEKEPAYRQSSYPGLRERMLVQNESKRHSMPLPLLYKKEMMNKLILSQDRTCDHVVEVTDTVRW